MMKQVLIGEGTGEITEKKSRFIANCFEIRSEQEALEKIEQLRRQYWDARHNCYAFVTGKNGEIQRFSDDKEPQGTAGKPILEVLVKNGLQNALIVVTRYFGGVLLGTGGLVRAYSSAASEGLKNCAISPVYEGTYLTVRCDYSASGKLQYIIGQEAAGGICLITDTLYDADVQFRILAEDCILSSLTAKITEATSGQAVIKKEDTVTFAVKDGAPVVLNNS